MVNDRQVERVRRFNRFYTRQIGLLDEGLLKSKFSLTEVRILYELAHHDGLRAVDITRQLGLDTGYLSRILRKFEANGLIQKSVSEADARESILTLTPVGREVFEPLNRASREQVSAMLADLAPAGRIRLVQAMETIERLLGAPDHRGVSYLLRLPHPGDIGWVVHRHGVLYAEEYGWDETFEALVAEIAGGFVKTFDHKSERCWIAEREGDVVGSVFLVRESDETAKLRLLYVEPAARGLGIGSRLVDECIRFAGGRGYRKITLWTNDVLVSARRIYEEKGFRLVDEKPHRSFGKDLVGQYWELDLAGETAGQRSAVPAGGIGT